MPTVPKIIFVLALALSFTGLLSPPIALTVGIVFGLSFPHPYINESRGIARTPLQSSVVGAATKYGAQALVIGTTVKLARALWIVPLALATAAVKHHRSRIQIPWFILFFILAAVLNTYVRTLEHITPSLFTLGRLGLTATLFLIGSVISRSTLKTVGWRPLLLGVLLWLTVGMTSLYFIRTGLIAF